MPWRHHARNNTAYSNVNIIYLIFNTIYLHQQMWDIGYLIHNLGWSLQWRHNQRDGISNHQPHDCLLKRLFRRRSKKTSKLCVTSLCEGNSPVTGEFPAQRASNAENVSIWWRHHGNEGVMPALIFTPHYRCNPVYKEKENPSDFCRVLSLICWANENSLDIMKFVNQYCRKNMHLWNACFPFDNINKYLWKI